MKMFHILLVIFALWINVAGAKEQPADQQQFVREVHDPKLSVAVQEKEAADDQIKAATWLTEKVGVLSFWKWLEIVQKFSPRSNFKHVEWCNRFRRIIAFTSLLFHERGWGQDTDQIVLMMEQNFIILRDATSIRGMYNSEDFITMIYYYDEDYLHISDNLIERIQKTKMFSAEQAFELAKVYGIYDPLVFGLMAPGRLTAQIFRRPYSGGTDVFSENGSLYAAFENPVLAYVKSFF